METEDDVLFEEKYSKYTFKLIREYCGLEGFEVINHFRVIENATGEYKDYDSLRDAYRKILLNQN